MITPERKADISYKSLKGVASTSTLRAYYEETRPFSPRVLPSQVWLQADLIPSVAPGGEHNETTGVVQRKIDVTLTQEPGKVNSWFSEDLKDSIDPERWGASYLFVVKGNSGATIPPGTGDYEINPDAGVLTFNDSYVPTDVPLKISFYKYVGVKGLQTSVGVSKVWVEDAASLRELTSHSDQDTMGVFGTSRVYKYIATSNLVDDGVSVIQPNDVMGTGRWIAWKVVPSTSEEMVLGLAPVGKSWDDGLIEVTSSSMQNLFNYEVSRILALIAPTPPQGISGVDLVMSLYSAKQSGTGDDHFCTDDTTPAASVLGILDPQSGVLGFESDFVEYGSVALTSGDDSGLYDGLNVVSNYDPYSGVSGKEGFYKALDVTVEMAGSLAVGFHQYQLLHSISGNSLLKGFWVDDPINSSISGLAVTRPASAIRYTSGVPSLEVGQELSFAFTLNNAVRTHYNPTRLAVLSGYGVGSLTVAPPVTPPELNTNPSFTGKALPVLVGVYSENIEVSVTPYNSKDVAGTPSTSTTGCRIDTVSDESFRKESGSGQYPASGYGAAFDSAISLKDVSYAEELQLLGGMYQVPSGNYASNLPTAGPDYSTGVGTGWRYCITSGPLSLNAVSGFTVTLEGGVGLLASDLDTDNIRIQVKVEGVTGWLDANSSFALVGAPSVDGDACMVYSDSSALVRRVSFGNVPRTGQMYIRVGLPSGSGKKFSGVTVSNIV